MFHLMFMLVAKREMIDSEGCEGSVTRDERFYSRLVRTRDWRRHPECQQDPC